MKKMLPWLVSLLLAITLIVTVGVYVWNHFINGSGAKDPAQQAKDAVSKVQAQPISADDIVKVTSELTDIKTNIADNNFVVMVSFTFQLDKAKTKDEFDKIKEIQIKPIINRALWTMQPGDFQGTKGKDQLCANLINSINSVLSEGKLTKVEIKDFLISQI
jgi:flagellar protein FliL